MKNPAIALTVVMVAFQIAGTIDLYVHPENLRKAIDDTRLLPNDISDSTAANLQSILLAICMAGDYYWMMRSDGRMALSRRQRSYMMLVACALSVSSCSVAKYFALR